MKQKFGLWPKFSLMLLVVGLVFHSFQVADDDLKAFKADQQVIEAGKGSPAQPLLQPAPVPYSALPTAIQKHQEALLPVAYSQTDDVPTIDVGDTPAPVESGGVWGFLKKYWAVLLPSILAVIEAIVRITPSDKDNSVFNFLKYILDKIIPNARSGGGTYA